MSNKIRVVLPQGTTSPDGQVGDVIEIQKDGVIILQGAITEMPTSPLQMDVGTVSDPQANGVLFEYTLDSGPTEPIDAYDVPNYSYTISLNANRWPNSTTDALDALMMSSDYFASDSGSSSSQYEMHSILTDIDEAVVLAASNSGSPAPFFVAIITDSFVKPAQGSAWTIFEGNGLASDVEYGGMLMASYAANGGEWIYEMQGMPGSYVAASASLEVVILDGSFIELASGGQMLRDLEPSNSSAGEGEIVIADASEVAAANAALGGQSVGGGELFASLIGRPDASGANASKQRHPEEIKLATGDVLQMGPLSMDKDWMVVSSVIQGQVSSLENQSTDSLIEGSINKYFSTARARASLSVVHNGPFQNGELAYDNLTGEILFSNVDESWVWSRLSTAATMDLNLSAGTDPLAAFVYNQNTGQMKLSTATLSDVHGTFSVELDNGDDRGLSYLGSGKYQLAQDLSNDGDVQFNDLTLTGNLKVSGQTTTVDSVTVTLSDKIIELAVAKDGETQVSADLAGFRIKRADGEKDVGLIWEQDDSQTANEDKGMFLFSKVQGVDPNDALLDPADLLRVKAQEFIGPVTGDVTGNVVGDVTGNVLGDLEGDVTGRITNISEKPDGSAHDTSELAEDPAATVESGTMYFKNTRVHAAVAADKGVSSSVTAGVETFEAAIKDVSSEPTAKLTIQKDNGLEIDFSVDSATVSDQRGSLSYSGNVLSFTPVTKADIQGDIDAENVPQVGKTVFGGIDYLNGMVKLTQVTREEVRGSISKGAEATPSEDGDISYDAASGILSYTPPATEWVRGRLSQDANAAASGAGDFSYDETTGVLQFTPVATDWVRGRLSEDAANHEAFIYDAAAGSLKLSLAATDAHDSTTMADADPQLAKLEISDAAKGEFKVKSLARSDARQFITAPAANRSAITAPAQWTNNDVLGGISYDSVSGEFSEELLTVGLIRSMFSAGDEQPDANAHSVLSYDANTGRFELNELAQSEIRGYIDVAEEVAFARGNTPIASTQKLADLAYAPASGQLTLTTLDIDDIHSTFKKDQASDGGLTYGDDGSFKMLLAASGDSALSYTKATSTFDLTITAADEAHAFAPTPADAAAENVQRCAEISWDGSEIGLKAMTVADFREMVSSSGDILSYDVTSGVVGASITAPAAAAATLSVDVDGNADDGSQKLGAISISAENGSIIDSEFLSIADIRKAIKVADNDEGLSYDRDTGIISIDDDHTRSSMTSEAICDGRMADGLVAPALIERGMLLGLGGQPVAGLEELWGCSGVAREQVAAGAALEQKVALPLPGSRKQLKVAFLRDENGNLTANQHVIAQGNCLYMSADQPGCVTPIMPEAEGEAVVLVGFADSANLDGADAGLVECLMSLQFMFNA